MFLQPPDSIVKGQLNSKIPSLPTLIGVLFKGVLLPFKYKFNCSLGLAEPVILLTPVITFIGYEELSGLD